MTISLISHPICELHEMGMGHPESPARLKAILQLLRAQTKVDLSFVEAEPLKAELACLAHEPAYIKQLLAIECEQGYVQLDADTAMNAFSKQAILLAAGAAVQGVELLLHTSAKKVFCAVRPPGHHAEKQTAMGFCFINNIALAAHYARKQGVARVAILDFDVHHGNGTEDIVAAQEGILFCSSFQSPLYPYSGTEASAKNIINSPLQAHSDGQALRQVVEQVWQPALQRFKPELILVSAGFDAHRLDPLAELNWREQDYYFLGQWIAGQAEEYCGGRVLASLEGGYDCQALANSVQNFLLGLEQGTSSKSNI